MANPGGRRVITCSDDDSLRLRDLESGIQIGDYWRDGIDEVGVSEIALSPNGSTVASGNGDGTVRLWDVKTGKVIVKWTGYAEMVLSVCWSPNGERVVSGCWDGIASIGYQERRNSPGSNQDRALHVWVVIYSPDSTKFVTGGDIDGVKIWDAKTGELLTTITHDSSVWSLAWTSDGKKLICRWDVRSRSRQEW